MTMKPEWAWYNFVTGECDYLSETPQDFRPYISQNKSAQALYDLLVNHKNKTPLEAVVQVLTACIGGTEEQT